jgi:ATP-dependent RNA helicase DDX51/DBP6
MNQIEEVDAFALEKLENVLDKSLIEKARSKGITQWFPVQLQVIPLFTRILQQRFQFRPRDLCVSSPTGSGKTLCFVLPIVQHLLNKVDTKLRVLVVLPGTDLASQVYAEFSEICRDTVVKVGSAIDGRPFSCDIDSIFAKPHNEALEMKIDILVATPGKLYDLLQNVPEFSLYHVHTLIMDEADRIVNSDLEYEYVDVLLRAIYNNSNETQCSCDKTIRDVQPSLSMKPKKERVMLSHSFNGCNLNSYSGSDNLVQLLFTATPTTDLEKLHKFKLFCPRFLAFRSQRDEQSDGQANVKVGHFSLPKELIQRAIKVSSEQKPAMIWYLIKELNYNQMLIFVNIKEDAHRLVLLLNQYPGLKVQEMTGNINPKLREKLRDSFTKGFVNAIVCSDIIARGIDMPDVNYVINYDLPARAHVYVHRVGRTARAGREGTAITLLGETDSNTFKQIWRKVAGRRAAPPTWQRIDASRFDPYLKFYDGSLVKLKQKVNTEKKVKNATIKSIMSNATQ